MRNNDRVESPLIIKNSQMSIDNARKLRAVLETICVNKFRMEFLPNEDGRVIIWPQAGEKRFDPNAKKMLDAMVQGYDEPDVLWTDHQHNGEHYGLSQVAVKNLIECYQPIVAAEKNVVPTAPSALPISKSIVASPEGLLAEITAQNIVLKSTATEENRVQNKQLFAIDAKQVPVQNDSEKILGSDLLVQIAQRKTALRKARPGDKVSPVIVPTIAVKKDPQAQKNTALIKAINKGDLAGVEACLKDGADADCKIQGRTPLIWAAAKAFQGAVKILLDHEKTNVHSKMGDGETALHNIAFRIQNDASKAEIAIAKLLLEKGADVNDANARGVTALHYAVSCNKPDLVKLLLKRGADASLRNNANETPKDLALNSDADLIRQLFDEVKTKPKKKRSFGARIGGLLNSGKERKGEKSNEIPEPQLDKVKSERDEKVSQNVFNRHSSRVDHSNLGKEMSKKSQDLGPPSDPGATRPGFLSRRSNCRVELESSYKPQWQTSASAQEYLDTTLNDAEGHYVETGNPGIQTTFIKGSAVKWPSDEKKESFSRALEASQDISKIGRFLNGDAAIAYLSALGMPAAQAMELPYDEPKRQNDVMFYVERIALNLLSLEEHVVEERFCPEDVTSRDINKSFTALKESFISVCQQRFSNSEKCAELKKNTCSDLIEKLREEHSQVRMKMNNSFGDFVIKKVASANGKEYNRAYRALYQELLNLAKATVFRKAEFTVDPLKAWGRIQHFNDAKRKAIGKDVEAFSKLWEYYKLQSVDSEQRALALAEKNMPEILHSAKKKLQLYDDKTQSVFIVADGPRGELSAVDYCFSAFQRLYGPKEKINVKDLYIIANEDVHWVMQRFRFDHKKKTIDRLVVDSLAQPEPNARLVTGQAARSVGKIWLAKLQGPLASYSVERIQMVATFQQLNDRISSRKGKLRQSTCLLYACENAKKNGFWCCGRRFALLH